MSTYERYIAHYHKNKPLNGFFRAGMALAKSKNVNRRFTYKELSIILGILVAVLVVLVLAMPVVPSHAVGFSFPEKPALGQTVLRVVLDILF
jgi:hypothetical protein